MAPAQPQRPASRDDFNIVIICALGHEANAVSALFDHFWEDDLNDEHGRPDPYGKAPRDTNAYTFGTIGRYNVVLAHMPEMGMASAARVAAHCQASFANIRLALVVGVCGVSPRGQDGADGDEIVLGDVIISTGVVQYDLGHRFPERFERKDTLGESLGRSPPEVRSILAKL